MKSFFKFSFLFYDYETFGIDPVKDKPAQFACLRTDIDFNIISKQVILYCYPPIDYLPNPKAVLLTSITPQYTLLNGFNESSFAKKIHDIFIQPNTCILGFNNIRFDDEITRNIFYRNFFEPYEWSWMNNNSRWDVIDLIRAFYALRPSGINWPLNKFKKISFKLEDLSKINNIFCKRSHDAFSDVFSTIEILKLLRKKNFNFFRFLFLMRKKKNLLSLIKKNFFKPLIYISHFYGSDKNNFCRIFPLTLHFKNKNILISFDLDREYDYDFFLKNKKKITKNVYDLFFYGMKFVHLNRSPVLIPINALRREDILRLKLNQMQYLKNIFFFKNFFSIKKIKEISKITFKNKCFEHSDYKLYESFFSTSDRIKIKKIRKNIDKGNINHNICVHDERFENLNFFFKARNFPNFLNKEEKLRWKKYLKLFFNKKKVLIYKENIFYLMKKYSNNLKKQKLLNKLLMYLKYLKKKYFM
jgi:exodeoxyribonuclease-1